MAQPTLANKLRLLQLTQDQRQFVLDNGLTERHARAVLRLPENRRSEALITIAKQKTAYEMESRDWSSDVCSSDLTSGSSCWTTA